MKIPILSKLPKSVKYLVCYLPFIVLGTVLVVVGVFQEGSARLASIIVGIVVLFSGLFAWCTDSEVGCLLICRYSSSSSPVKDSATEKGLDEEARKSPISTDSTRGRSPDIEASLHNTTAFTITNNRTTIINNHHEPITVNNNHEDGKSTTEVEVVMSSTRVIQNNRMARYGNYSLQQKPPNQVRKQRFGDDTILREKRAGAFSLRNRDGDPVNNNVGFANFGRNIKKNRKSRLTISNVNAMNACMINRSYQYSEGDLRNIPYEAEGFHMDLYMDRVKHNAISNWVIDVSNSMEDLANYYPDPVGKPRTLKRRDQRQLSLDHSTGSTVHTESNSIATSTPDIEEEGEEIMENKHGQNNNEQHEDLARDVEIEMEMDQVESINEHEEYDMNDYSGSVSMGSSVNYDGNVSEERYI